MVTTLLGQIVEAPGINFSEDEAGYFGIILIAVGLVTAGVVAPILDYTHKYKEIYCSAFLICCAAALGCKECTKYFPSLQQFPSLFFISRLLAFSPVV